MLVTQYPSVPFDGKALGLLDLICRHHGSDLIPVISNTLTATPVGERGAIPSIGLNEIPWDLTAPRVKLSQADLGVRVTLSCGTQVPLEGPRRVPWDAAAE